MTEVGVRLWRQNERALVSRGAVTRAAVHGETIGKILDLGARSLLQIGPAQRAGIWLEGLLYPEIYSGTAVRPNSDPLPEEWKYLDVSVPFYKTLLESDGPVVTEVGEFAGVSLMGALAGMSSAAWCPLRLEQRRLGLAMVAYASRPSSVDTETLRWLVDEIAVVVAQRRDRELAELRQAELVSLGQAHRAILRGTPVHQILSQILSDARRHSNAEFVALGQNGGGRLRFEFLDGPREWRAWIEEEPVARVCYAAVNHQRAMEAGWDMLRSGRPQRDLLHAERVSRVVAVPVEAHGRKLGVLLAGLAPTAEPAGEVERLEIYATLVAALLDSSTRPSPAEAYGRAEAELDALLDSVESGVLLFDAAGGVRHVNDRFAQLVGLNARRLRELESVHALGEAVAGHFRDPQAFSALRRELLQFGDRPVWDELEMVRPTRKLVERIARPVLDPCGGRLGWLEVYRDITGQRLVQSKLLQTEKMAALGQLVSGIAHELNNPLTSIMGYAQLLLSRRLGPEGAADADRIYREAERAGRIVKNLLLFARETRPERRAVNLNEVIERTLALRSYELKVENIAVECELDPNLPPTLADANQMQQAFLNLVVNAEHAIQQGRGHGHIRVRAKCISDERLVLEVGDDGPGMPPETASRIFDPFFTTKPVGEGTGLGLSIVYGIVQAHGGEISVETQPGQGTTFRVELPVFAVAAPDFKDAGSAETGMGQRALGSPLPVPADDLRAGEWSARVPARRECVLVVEDEPTVAQLIADVLREEGHLVDIVLDSRAALERLGLRSYDLVICDLKMPHLDGRAFFRALVRAGSPLQHRIVFVTGDTLAPRTLEFLNRSGLPYVAKPFLVEELKLAVQRALRANRPEAQVAAAGQSSAREPDTP